MLDLISNQNINSICSAHAKRKRKEAIHQDFDACYVLNRKLEDPCAFTSSLLDVLLLKKNMKNRLALVSLYLFLYSVLSELQFVMYAHRNQYSLCRISLVGPLFKLLHKIFMDNDWIRLAADSDTLLLTSSSQTTSSAVIHIQQTSLLLLEDIATSITTKVLPVPFLSCCASRWFSRYCRKCFLFFLGFPYQWLILTLTGWR